MNFQNARVLIEGQEVCIAATASVSAFKIVAEDLTFPGECGENFQARLLEGEKFPVIVYLGEGNEKVAGEAFSYPQTPSRLHVDIWRLYALNPSTGRWEA